MRVSPREGEVGIYLDFLEAGLRFPFVEGLALILRHYRLPLCCYSLSSLRLMIAFLSLIRKIKVPFSLSVFRHMYCLRVVKNNSWPTVAARSGLGVINGFPRLDPNWRSRFVFMGVPKDFCLPRSWIDIKGFRDSNPHKSEADSVPLKVLSNAALAEVRYSDLMSESSLADDDGMGMLGSMLDIASQQLGTISLKRTRPSDEGAKFSSPPPTPGNTVPGNGYRLPE